MRHARAVEKRPLRTGNRALIADGQRHQHAAIRRIGQCGNKAVTHRLAQALDQITGTHDESIEPLIAAANTAVGAIARPLVRPHRAQCTNIALQQPCLVIEALRIGIAVRTP